MLPDSDDLSVFGQPRKNRKAVDDPTTDVGAEHMNPVFNDLAMLSRLAVRVWASFHYTGSAMVLDSNDEMWRNVASYTLPVVARTSAGIYTVTYPTQVNDLIGPNYPGGSATPHNVNLRFGDAKATNTDGVTYGTSVICAANVMTVYLRTGGSLVDVNNLVINAWAR